MMNQGDVAGVTPVPGLDFAPALLRMAFHDAATLDKWVGGRAAVAAGLISCTCHCTAACHSAARHTPSHPPLPSPLLLRRGKGVGGANGSLKNELDTLPNSDTRLVAGWAALEQYKAAIDARLAGNPRVRLA